MQAHALVDANNFYATCEKIFQPGLEGVPLVVLSNNDGCIVSRSAEARALGLPMAAPIHQWQGFCEQHGVVIRSSNYTLYGDMSERMLMVLQGLCPVGGCPRFCVTGLPRDTVAPNRSHHEQGQTPHHRRAA